MEVVIKGQPPEERVYGLQCRTCGTEFKFKESEGRYQAGDYREGPMVIIACPICHRDCYAYPGQTSSMTPSERAKAYYEK
jgi:hypothetical protein